MSSAMCAAATPALTSAPARLSNGTVKTRRSGATRHHHHQSVAPPSRCRGGASSARASATATTATASETAAIEAATNALRPSSADCAKTLVHLANTGTISTTCDDGVALGTFASYVVDEDGGVVLRMRADAMHTKNIASDPRCSLYVQPATQPPGVLSRATLIGKLEKLDAEDAEKAAIRYDRVHGENVGVDAMQRNDDYYAFVVDRVFYVGGLGSDKRAEVVDAAAFADAVADPLSAHAASIVDAMNNDRYEDVVNFARASLPDEAEPAEARMLWVDSLGFDVRVITSGALSGGSGNGKVLDVRLPFPAPATTTQRALSSLTMLAQTIWEEEKKYEPVLVPVEMPEKKDD